MGRKTRVGVVFGGRSGEHEVSLRSAASVMAAIDRARFEVVAVGVSKDGAWLLGGDAWAFLAARADARLLGDARPPEPTGEPVRGGGSRLPDASFLAGLDVVFPVLHGPYGEDGTLQGLLELVGVPYVGAGVAASALIMDKVLFKDLMRAHGLPVVEQRVVGRERIEAGAEVVAGQIGGALGYPVFTKPANLGSSVGISKCKDRDGLVAGLREAARYDQKVVVEAAVPEAREIEIAILGNGAPEASVAGEILPSREFYDYASKYLDDGDRASQLLIPAPLDPAIAGRLAELALGAYRAVDCAGLARADFLLSRATGAIYINELNTLPGFTSISMYPKLWAASGLGYGALISRLIELGLERHAARQKNRIAFEPA